MGVGFAFLYGHRLRIIKYIVCNSGTYGYDAGSDIWNKNGAIYNSARNSGSAQIKLVSGDYLKFKPELILKWEDESVFFIMGINQGRKDFEYNRMVTCNNCGSYGRYQVFMTYMCLSLFFIPFFKWNKQYYVQSTCCNTVYALNPEIGKQIAGR